MRRRMPSGEASCRPGRAGGGDHGSFALSFLSIFIADNYLSLNIYVKNLEKLSYASINTTTSHVNNGVRRQDAPLSDLGLHEDRFPHERGNGS